MYKLGAGNHSYRNHFDCRNAAHGHNASAEIVQDAPFLPRLIPLPPKLSFNLRLYPSRVFTVDMGLKLGSKDRKKNTALDDTNIAEGVDKSGVPAQKVEQTVVVQSVSFRSLFRWESRLLPPLTIADISTTVSPNHSR